MTRKTVIKISKKRTLEFRHEILESFFIRSIHFDVMTIFGQLDDDEKITVNTKAIKRTLEFRREILESFF